MEGELLLGKYRLERELGRGGMGVVVAARHVDLDEPVAIKMILPSAAANKEAVRRFMREARAAAKIKNEHVARVSDVGLLSSGAPYMVMERLEGEDLEQIVRSRGPLPVAEAVEYLLQAMEAVAEAHAHGIVHRDLKPANLFVTRKRSGAACVKVLDFGISKVATTSAASAGLTNTEALLGSPIYMSPEQIESSRDVDARTDIWAFGVTLFQLITDRYPFLGDSMAQLVRQIIDKPPVSLRSIRAEVPAGLQAIIEKCLQKKRDLRYPNITSLAAALAPFAASAGQLSLTAIASTLPMDTPPTIALYDASPSSAVEGVAGVSSILDASGSGTQASTFAPLGNTRDAPRPPTLARGRTVRPVVVIGFATGLVLLATIATMLLRRAGSDSPAAAAPTPREHLAAASSPDGAASPAAPSTSQSALEVVAPPSTPSARQPGSPVSRATPIPSTAPGDVASAKRPPPVAASPAAPTKPSPPTDLTTAAPTTVPTAPGPATRSTCEPPYILNESGEKVWKPECFK